MRHFKLILCFCVLFLPVAFGTAQAEDGYEVLSSAQVSNRLLDLNGQRRALFVYASWCPYCRKALPDIMKAYKGSGGAVLPVSVDQDPQVLVDYMGAYDAPGFPLFVWDRNGNLANALVRFGISMNGGIPFIALLNESGDVYKQGHIDAKEVAAYLQAGKTEQAPATKNDI